MNCKDLNMHPCIWCASFYDNCDIKTYKIMLDNSKDKKSQIMKTSYAIDSIWFQEVIKRYYPEYVYFVERIRLLK